MIRFQRPCVFRYALRFCSDRERHALATQVRGHDRTLLEGDPGGKTPDRANHVSNAQLPADYLREEWSEKKIIVPVDDGYRGATIFMQPLRELPGGILAPESRP